MVALGVEGRIRAGATGAAGSVVGGADARR